MREINATELGRIEHNRVALIIYTTVTALCGCPLRETFDTQEESGRAPSQAIAKTSRDAASTMTLSLRVEHSQLDGKRFLISTITYNNLTHEQC